MFPHYQIYISDSPNPCIHFIEYIFNHHQTRAFISSNTYIHITAHAFPPPFRVCLRICGHDKSAPTAANGLPITWRTLRKHSTPTHEMPHEYPASRRGPIHRARILTLPNTHIRTTEYMYPHYHTHISTSSNTCIHFIEYVYSFHRTRISPSITCVFTYMRAR